MASVKLEFKIDDLIAQNALKSIEKFNAFSMFDEIGQHLTSEAHQRFKDGIGPDGNVWQESERAKTKGGKTLVKAGHLRDSLTYIVFLDGSGVEQGSDMVYAAIHQFGGKAGRNKSVDIVARPFLGLTDDDHAEINGIVEGFLSEALN